MNDQQAQIDALAKELNQLREEFYRNNFTSNQDFTKTSTFKSRIRIFPVSALPATCQVGELASYNGKLYHCSATNTWSPQT